MTRARHILLAGCCALAVTGCAATTARQSMSGPGPPTLPLAALPSPPSESHSTAQGSQQSGQGNVTGQIDASGWKGVEYTTAVPVGQVILMGMMLWLSHRREVLRIKQNGKGAYVAPCSSSLKSLDPGLS